MGTRDFRSDTITKPTEKMRKAMYEAEVGDDVCEDDPTVKKLEALASEKLGMEAGLFVPSGTFGNQLCILTHTQMGDEIILSEQAHIIKHEAGAASVLSSVQTLTVDTKGSYLKLDDIKKRIRDDDIHYPKTGLICLENALANGTVMPVEEMERVYKYANSLNIPIHIDGARLFNAALSLGVKPEDICQYTDSVMFCLSKGLCAPIGSIVCGTKAFIDKARKNRKIMGGGMRQVGVIAAPGIVALTDMIDRLEEDHHNAKYLGERLVLLDEVDIDIFDIHINIVFFKLNDKSKLTNKQLIDELIKKGFNLYPPEDGLIRLVTNYGVDREDIDNLMNEIERIIQ